MGRLAGVLLACVIAFGGLVGPSPVHAQTQPIVNGIVDSQCQQDAVSQCDAECGDDGPCKFGCQIGGINSLDTCTSSCTGLGAPCLNACMRTIDRLAVCQLPRVNGVVSGLGTGRSVTLQNNGGDTLTVGENGAFAFPISVIAHTPYAVTVSDQPEGQTCVVANGSGLAPLYTVTGVAVTCVSPVPTLSTWGTVLLAGLVAICGLVLLRPAFARASLPEA